MENLSYLDKVVLNKNSKIEPKWWVKNLELYNGQALIQPPAEVLIQTDVSQTTGGNVQWNLNRRDVLCSGNEKPHKCLRNLAHKTGHTNVLKNLEAQNHSGEPHGSFNISEIITLIYFSNNYNFYNFNITEISSVRKRIWDHFLQCGITITAV